MKILREIPKETVKILGLDTLAGRINYNINWDGEGKLAEFENEEFAGDVAFFKNRRDIPGQSDYDTVMKKHEQSNKREIHLDSALVCYAPYTFAYGHFLIDGFPKASFQNDAAVEAIIMPKTFDKLRRKFLKVFSTQKKIYWAGDDLCFKVKKAVVPILSPIVFPFRFIEEYYSKLLGTPRSHGDKKIFIYRGDGRTSGEDEKAKAAEKLGYKVMKLDDVSLHEIYSIFKNATHIVGGFGSGFNNVIFSKPQTKVGIACQSDHSVQNIFDSQFPTLNAFSQTQLYIYREEPTWERFLEKMK
jgi:capsular polysaccharide biosynthesis protein